VILQNIQTTRSNAKCVTKPKSVILLQPFEHNFGDLPEKNWPLTSRHSKSLEPTRIDRQPTTSY